MLSKSQQLDFAEQMRPNNIFIGGSHKEHLPLQLMVFRIETGPQNDTTTKSLCMQNVVKRQFIKEN